WTAGSPKRNVRAAGDALAARSRSRNRNPGALGRLAPSFTTGSGRPRQSIPLSPVHGASECAEAGRRPTTRPEGRAYSQPSTSHETTMSAPAVPPAPFTFPTERHRPNPGALLSLAPSFTTGSGRPRQL